MLDYYQSLKDALTEEQDGATKYIELSKLAPNDDAKETLIKIAKQEIKHRAKIECLLLDQGLIKK